MKSESLEISYRTGFDFGGMRYIGHVACRTITPSISTQKKAKEKTKKTCDKVFQVSQFGLIIHSNGDLLGTENIQKIIALPESFHVKSCFRTVFA